MKLKTHLLNRILLIALGVVIALITLHIIYIRFFYVPKASSKPTPTPAALHSTDEAVKAAADLYRYYLPLKARVAADVGDNAFVEPALVQVVRGSKVYFDTKLYNDILADYTDQYRSTGKVTKDAVACAANTTDASTAAFVSTSASSAVVNVTLTLADATTKVVPVTIDLHTLKATHISCQ